jgi:hypothetical protein
VAPGKRAVAGKRGCRVELPECRPGDASVDAADSSSDAGAGTGGEWVLDDRRTYGAASCPTEREVGQFADRGARARIVRKSCGSQIRRC